MYETPSGVQVLVFGFQDGARASSQASLSWIYLYSRRAGRSVIVALPSKAALGDFGATVIVTQVALGSRATWVNDPESEIIAMPTYQS